MKRMEEKKDVYTIEEAVNFATDAAREAYDQVKESSNSEYHATAAARETYRNCMPLLETRSAVKAFIASVAMGVGLGYIDNEEARLMMYGAQVWLQVDAGRAEGMVTGE